jgi:hypothetical protein
VENHADTQLSTGRLLGVAFNIADVDRLSPSKRWYLIERSVVEIIGQGLQDMPNHRFSIIPTGSKWF